jgi:hypothetical protein
MKALVREGEKQTKRRKSMKEHGLTFPVVLQKKWEISRDYAYFATRVAYLADGNGIITAGVAVGVEAIEDLLRIQSVHRYPPNQQHNTLACN